jgi:hypothetical protein
MIVAAVGLFLGPLADPDRERKIQAQYGAEYLLNGGEFVEAELAATLDLAPRTQLYLLLRGPEVLLLPRHATGDVVARLLVTEIREILVGRQTYVPVYVSEAKDPPVREETVDRAQQTLLQLRLSADRYLHLRYRGPFSKHLAETAAHAVYSVRKLRDAAAGQPPEVFHIIGS